MDKSHIEQSSTTFRGIIPSREARCSRKIKLYVVFGTRDNYRSEELLFHVAPFNSGYHALLGREAFTIFQAIPHYGYMKLKMPGPNGVITIASDEDIALHAENKTACLALVKEICPRGNNKVDIYISLYHDKCLLFMLELY